MNFLKIFISILFSIFCSYKIQAEFLYLNRSQEGLLMGDAFTAIADDESTLFYNPAALGRHRGVSLTPFKINLQGPDLLDKDIGFDGFNFGLDESYTDLPKDPGEIASRILGKPIYFQLGGSPSIKMNGFGMNLFAVSKNNFVLNNAIHPSLELTYRLDRGVIFGYGFNLGKSPQSKNPTGIFSSIGVGIKSMNRQGLDTSVDLFGGSLLEILDTSDSYKELRKGLGFSKGSGYGLDLGYELNRYSGSTRLGFGASLLDVGDTRFSKSEGTVDVPNQDMSLNLGLAYELKTTLFSYSLAADYHNLIDPLTPLASKLHLGARLEIPFFSAYLGWNGGYMSYGVGVEAFMFKVLLGFYGTEIGHSFSDKEGKRLAISISLLEIEFDQLF